MAAGNNSLNRIAGSGQSRLLKAGDSYDGPISHFVVREDTVIGSLEEQVIYNNAVSDVNVLLGTVTLPNSKTIPGQNIDGETLKAGEIYVPRFSAFTQIEVTSGSVVVYLLLPPKDIDRKLNDNI